MIKIILGLSVLLAFWGLSANAQIATPNLDRNMETQAAAATGWRAGSSAGLQAASLKGDVEMTSSGATSNIGDAEIGGSTPAASVVLKGENAGLELYLSTGKEVKGDTSSPYLVSASPLILGTYDSKVETTLSETRLNIAYVIAESISVGLGYRKNEDETQTDSTLSYVHPVIGATSSSTSVKNTESETGSMLSASFKVAEIFYLAAGMEAVTLTNTSDDGSDYVDNEWSNTLMGLGILIGEQGDTQFRMEYSMIQSGESEKDATDGKLGHTHPKTDQAFVALEAKFGDFILSYLSESKKEDYSSGEAGDSEQILTKIGLGWMPEEGISVSAYSLNLENKSKQSSTTEIKKIPKGYQINLGWNF